MSQAQRRGAVLGSVLDLDQDLVQLKMEKMCLVLERSRAGLLELGLQSVEMQGSLQDSQRVEAQSLEFQRVVMLDQV